MCLLSKILIFVAKKLFFFFNDGNFLIYITCLSLRIELSGHSHYHIHVTVINFDPSTTCFRAHPRARIACQSLLQMLTQVHLCFFYIWRAHLWFILHLYWVNLVYSFCGKVHDLGCSAVWAKPVCSNTWSLQVS